MNKGYYILFFLFFSLFIIAGCGIKGPPLPPATETTIQKQKVEEEEAQRKKAAEDKTKSNGQTSRHGS